MLLGACAVKKAPDKATPGPVPDNDVVIVIAEVNGQPIYRNEYLRTLESLSTQMGVPLDNPEMVAVLEGLALESVVTEKAMIIALEERGYMDLTSQQLSDVDQMIQEQLDMYINYYKPQIEAELGDGYTDAQFEDKVAQIEQQYYREVSMTREQIEYYFISQIGVDKGMEELLVDVEPTEQQIVDRYDAKLAADTETVGEDAVTYEAMVSQGEPPYYKPEGLRKVRHVLIAFDEETMGMMMGYRYEGEDDKAEALVAQKLPEIQTKADDALAKLQSDEITFDEAIETYGDDPGMASQPEGYLVFDGCETYLPEFTDGGMSLENVGDITELIATDYGYHIIEYTSDVAAGAVPFDEVRDALYEQIAPAMKQQAWLAMVEEWKKDMVIKIFEDKA